MPPQLDGLLNFTSMKEIAINSKKHGTKILLIDDEDMHIVENGSWYLKPGKAGNFYVAGRFDGKRGFIHRFIMNTPKDEVVDHLDGSGLNCQKTNMKNCTVKENNYNTSSQKMEHTTSTYRGVSFSMEKTTNRYGKIYYHGRWRAQIQKDGKRITIGRYKTELDAAYAWNLKAEQVYGIGNFRPNVLPDDYKPVNIKIK